MLVTRRCVDRESVDSSRPVIRPARFVIDGLTVEVRSRGHEGDRWQARVVAPVQHDDWHAGSRAWTAISAARDCALAERD
jgi:hypothetical protein